MQICDLEIIPQLRQRLFCKNLFETANLFSDFGCFQLADYHGNLAVGLGNSCVYFTQDGEPADTLSQIGFFEIDSFANVPSILKRASIKTACLGSPSVFNFEYLEFIDLDGNKIRIFENDAQNQKMLQYKQESTIGN